jgi:menaquinone-dependent protoporphyrinogen oxidase
MTTILVAYATKKGSTREVAASVAETLRESGFAVDLQPAATIDSLRRYDGVVLGSALYMGRPHPDARRFLKRHQAALAAVPTAVFAMGPGTLAKKDVDGSRHQLERTLAKVPEIVPVATAIFGGVVDPKQLSFPFSHMPASDERDWDAIHDWAKEVAEAIECCGNPLTRSEKAPQEFAGLAPMAPSAR